MHKRDENGISCKSNPEKAKGEFNNGYTEYFKRFLVALRPWSFAASFTPVALGSTLGYKATGEFSICIFIVTCLTALSVHAAGNLVNTYYDFLRGIDKKDSDDRTLVDHLLEPNVVAYMGTMFYCFGIAGFIILHFISGARLEHLALIFFCGLSSSFLYTGGLGLKYIALGDILILLTFGPLTVMFSFLSQVGRLSMVTLLYAMPLALNTEAILHSNNTRDMEVDKKAKIVTLAIILGRTGSYILFAFLMFGPYIAFFIMGLHISKWLFLPVLTVWKAFDIERQFRSGNLHCLPQTIAKLNLVLGTLYVLGIWMCDGSLLPNLL